MPRTTDTSDDDEVVVVDTTSIAVEFVEFPSIDEMETWTCNECATVYVGWFAGYSLEQREAAGITRSIISTIYDGTPEQEVVHEVICQNCVDNNYYFSEYYDNHQVCAVDDDALYDENIEDDDYNTCNCEDCVGERGHRTDTPPAPYQSVMGAYCSCKLCNAPALGKYMSMVAPYTTDILEHCKGNLSQPVFGRTKLDTKHSMTLGVELELVTKDSDTAEDRKVLLHDVHHAFLKSPTTPRSVKRRHCLTKSDASIQPQGFELVTSPCTLAYHKVLWEHFFEKCASRFEQPNSSVGMHVHVGREAFTQLSLSKLIIFMNNEKNLGLVYALAGRETSSYSVVKEASWGAVKETSTERSNAVNVTNEKTVEIRIFSSTLDKEVLYRNLEFVHAAVKFTAVTSNRFLNKASFIKYVLRNTSVYPMLNKFFKSQAPVVMKTWTKEEPIIIPRSKYSKGLERYRLLKKKSTKKTDTTGYLFTLLESFNQIALSSLTIRPSGRFDTVSEYDMNRKVYKDLSLDIIDTFLTLLSTTHRNKNTGQFCSWEKYLATYVTSTGGTLSIELNDMYRWWYTYLPPVLKHWGAKDFEEMDINNRQIAEQFSNCQYYIREYVNRVYYYRELGARLPNSWLNDSEIKTALTQVKESLCA